MADLATNSRPLTSKTRAGLPARARALDLLRDGIISGTLAPGTQLRELKLAQELGVSQAVVREALIQLEGHGLVTRVPNARTTVVKLTVKEARDRIKVRLALEELVMREVVPGIDAAAVGELKTLAGALEDSANRGEYFDVSQADLEFHRYLWRRSGNDILCQSLERATAPLFAAVGIVRLGGGSPRMQPFKSAHVELADTIGSGKVETAVEAIRDHILTFQAKFLAPENLSKSVWADSDL